MNATVKKLPSNPKITEAHARCYAKACIDGEKRAEL